MIPLVSPYVNGDLKENILFQNEQLHYSIYSPKSEPQFYGDILWHWHEEFEFGYVIKGTLLYKTSHQEYVLKEGDGIFLNSGALHYIHLLVPAGNARIHSQFFDRKFLGGSTNSIFDTKYIAPVMQQKQLQAIPFYRQNKEDQYVLRQLTETIRMAHRQPLFYEFNLRNLFSSIWETVYMRATEQIPSQELYNLKEEERIKKILTFIQEHYSEKLTVARIAGCVPISERECYRLFQNRLGTTPAEFLLSVRLKKARVLLSSTQKSIVEVALESGFSNSSYFGKLFRQQYLMSPGEYRRKM